MLGQELLPDGVASMCPPPLLAPELLQAQAFIQRLGAPHDGGSRLPWPLQTEHLELLGGRSGRSDGHREVVLDLLVHEVLEQDEVVAVGMLTIHEHQTVVCSLVDLEPEHVLAMKASTVSSDLPTAAAQPSSS